MNPFKEVLEDEELDNYGIVDIDIRMRIWEARERVERWRKYVDRAIWRYGRMRRLSKDEIMGIQILVGNFFSDELDFMLNEPENYLNIQEGYYRPSDDRGESGIPMSDDPF